MRNSGSNIVTALTDAPSKGLVALRFVTIWPRSYDTDERVPFCFWSDPVPAAIAIANRTTGDLETRNFIGDGVLIDCAPVKLSLGIAIRNWSFTLNALHPAVLDMVTNHDLRLAPVEYHRVPGSTRSRRPVDDPARRFLGVVDGSPRPTAPVNGDSSIAVSCTSETLQLTRTNPTKRSEVAGRRRAGDEQMQYVAVAGDWDVAWGQASGSVE